VSTRGEDVGFVVSGAVVLLTDVSADGDDAPPLALAVFALGTILAPRCVLSRRSTERPDDAHPPSIAIAIAIAMTSADRRRSRPRLAGEPEALGRAGPRHECDRSSRASDRGESRGFEKRFSPAIYEPETRDATDELVTVGVLFHRYVDREKHRNEFISQTALSLFAF
jgi:hypothetical protein